MSIIVSHPTGNANVRAVVKGFADAGLLERFYTSVAYFEKSSWLKSVIKDISRREFDNSLKPFTKTHPWLEIGRQFSNKLGLQFLTGREKSIFGIDAVYKSLDKWVSGKISASGNNAMIYAYEDGSYNSFKAAREKGIPCLYDLPIAYWKTARSLLLEEAARLPQWKRTLGGGISDSLEKLERKTAELDMADLVITPSQFVADSVVSDMPWKKVIISPFGTPPATINDDARPGKFNSKKLRVLFVGSMSQRKGLADLASAIKMLKNPNIELVVLGSLLESSSFYKKQLPPYIYEPPRPHHEVLGLMATCDVFCLPSVVEGRALVMQEAMSKGLPVIITRNTGGEDLVKEGQTGFIVPVRSPEAIAEKLNWFWENKGMICDMGKAAKAHAAQYTWEAYASKIIASIFVLK